MKLKKSLSFASSFAIICSLITPAYAQNPTTLKSLDTQPKKQEDKITKLKYDERASKVNDSDEVRVIVELQDEPLIEYATKKGKKVSQLNKNEANAVTKKLKDKQDKVKNAAKTKGIKFKEHNSFTNVSNGFSISTTYKEAKEIENIDGVKSVTITNEYQRPEPLMNTSNDIVKSPQTWEELGYDGEGTVVSVIDTGVDPSHKDMVLTNNDKAEYNEKEINDIKGKENLGGTYRSAKVPYGYNYMDNNQEILDLGPGASEHGMHVAGTVGANGDKANGGIKGVAPETQILAMKVFGNNPQMPSTFGDVIIKAIDDSVLLGADVINMSLGSTASYVLPKDPEQVAVRRATENGVVCAISAGNSNAFGSGWDNPYAKNPDIGVVGSPGLSTESIQVASIENTHVVAELLEYILNNESVSAGYINAGNISMFEKFKGQQAEYVYCGLGGKPEEFPSEVNGKIALIQRGGYNFVDKIMNAQNAGATGVIVFNHAAGGEGLMSMAYPSEGKIPAIFIGESHGLNLVKKIENKDNTLEFKGNKASVPSPSAGQMSSFTSWGVTPSLDFKPEITAPGGNIWSTAQNNGYQGMSGTSMASPHVAGGASLILQRVDKEFNLSGQERVTMAKNLLMSTAKAHEDKGKYQSIAGTGNYTSPRRQGAGVMDLYAASTTPVIVTDKDSKISKVNLREIGNKSEFTLTLQNFSDKEVTYNVGGNVQTDLTDGDYNYLQAQAVYTKGTKNHPISFDKKEVTVPANASAEVVVSVDLSNAVTAFGGVALKDIFESGTFVEGFVKFKDVEDNAPELTIPYVGFYGEWDEASIIDDSNYDKNGTPFYGLTAMSWLDKEAGQYNFLGYDVNGKNPDANNIAFSPNNDGYMDDVVPVVSLLRNARELDIDILDEKGNVIRDLAIEEYLRKNYHDGRYAKHTSKDIWTWDGTANNKLVKDGNYTYRIKTRIDMEGSKWQTLDFPVRVDTVSPKVEAFIYDDENKTLDIKANDGEHPIFRYQIVDKDKVIYESATNETIDLKTLNYSNKAEVRVYDYAGNYTRKNLPGHNEGEIVPPTNPETPETPSFTEPTGPMEGDKTIPTIDVLTPEFLSVVNNSKVVFKGTISDESSMDYFTVNGKNVEYKFNKVTGKWDFEVSLELKNGYNAIQFAGKDSAGNAIDFTHKIFVDTNAPVININEPPKQTRESSIVLTGKISDNLPGMKVLVNGNMIANLNNDWEEYVDQIPPANFDLKYEVKLVKGNNVIVLEASDDAGNITTKTINIKRK